MALQSLVLSDGGGVEPHAVGFVGDIGGHRCPAVGMPVLTGSHDGGLAVEGVVAGD